MEDVAREAGITRPILYRHFGDRDGLAQAVAQYFAGQLFEEMRSVLDKDFPTAGGDPRRVVEEAIGAFFSFVDKEPNLYRFVLHRAWNEDVRSKSSLAGLVEILGQRIAVIVGEMLREAKRDSGPAEPWSVAIIGMVALTADWWLERGLLTRQRVVSYLTSLLADGFSGAPQIGEEQRDSKDRSSPVAGAARSAAIEVLDAAAHAVGSTIRRVPRGADK
jgi:AcrR family transcriptional regulator